jgi:hypothetical protein
MTHGECLCSLTLAAWTGGIACGGLAKARGNDNSDAMASSDAEAIADQASEGEGGPPSSPCPSTPPAAGTSCADEGQTCGWGDDVRGDPCRTIASCTRGLWQVSTPNAQACPPLQPIGACPAAVLTATCMLPTAASSVPKTASCGPLSP